MFVCKLVDISFELIQKWRRFAGIARLKVSIDVYFGRKEAGVLGGGEVGHLLEVFGIWRADELRAVRCKSRTVILYPCVLGIPYQTFQPLNHANLECLKRSPKKTWRLAPQTWRFTKYESNNTKKAGYFCHSILSPIRYNLLHSLLNVVRYLAAPV